MPLIDIRAHGGAFGGKKEPQYTFERKHPTIDARTSGTASLYYNGSGNSCTSFMQRHTDLQAHIINGNSYVHLFSHDFMKMTVSVLASPRQVFVTSERNIIVSYSGRNWVYALASENYANVRDIANTTVTFGNASYVFEYGNYIIFVEFGNSRKVMAINKSAWSLAWYADFAQMTFNDIKGAFVYDKYLFVVSEQKKFYKIDMTTGTIVSTYVMNTTGLYLIDGNVGAFDGQYFYLVGRSGSSYTNTPHKIHKFDTAGNLISTMTFDYSNIGVNVQCGLGYTLDFVKNRYLIFTTGYDYYGSTILVVDVTTAKVITGWQHYDGANHLFGQVAIGVVVAGSGLCVKHLVNSSTWFKWGEA